MSSRPAVLLHNIDVRLIDPDPDQPRRTFGGKEDDDLVSSIEQSGVIHPIIIRLHPKTEGRYMVVDGERRWRGATAAGLLTISCLIKTGELDNLEIYELQLIANLHQRKLNPMDEAEAFASLISKGRSVADVARIVGLDSLTVSNRLKLRTLPPVVQDAIRHGKLPQQAALNLAQFRGPKGELLRLAHELIRGEAPPELTPAALRSAERGDALIQAKLPSDPRKLFRRILELGWRERSSTPVFERFLALSAEEQFDVLRVLPRKRKEELIERLKKLSEACQRFAAFLGEHLVQEGARPAVLETAKPQAALVVELPKPTSKSVVPTAVTLAPNPTPAKIRPQPVVSQAEWATRHAQATVSRKGGPELVEPPKPIAKAGDALEVLTAMFYYNSPARLQVCLSQQVLRQRLRLNGADGQLAIRVKEALKAARENWKRPLNTKDPQEKALIQLISSLRFDSGDTTFEEFVEFVPKNDRSSDPINIESFV